ncbi:MAG: ABC transporter permease YtrF [Calditrichaeota bacterium]|nr:ABC transporter permease YtrF [Calditrichota bacterium]
MRLLLRIVFRGWSNRPGRTLLALGGIAVGVAVLIAVRLANHSAVEAFARTLEMVSGRADAQIFAAGEGWMDASIYAPLSRMDAIRTAAPVFIVDGREARSERRVRLLGVDLARDATMRPWYRAELGGETDPVALFSHPRGMLVTPALARELGVETGGWFEFRYGGRVDSLKVLGLLEGEDVAKAQTRDVIVMDLPRAWQLTGRPERLHRIDVLFEPGVDRDAAIEALRLWLGDGVRVEPSGWKSEQAQKLLSSFRLNLTALAFVALLVAGFLVFQTVNTTAVERRRNAGVLRSLGGSRRFVRAVFYVEGAVLGVIGSALGIGLGMLLARIATSAVSRTVESVYLLETTDALYVTPEAVATSFLLGVAVSLAAVLPVAWEASTVPPRESISRQVLEQRLRGGRLALIALALAIGGGILTRWPLAAHPVLSGYAAAALFILAGALATPWGLTVLHRAVTRLFGRRLSSSARLALGVLVRSRHRVAPAVAALATAVAMWLSVDMMVRSFRSTVDTWVTNTITADLIVTSGAYFGVGKPELIPGEIFHQLKRAEGIADVDHFRSVRVPVDGLPTVIAMVDMESVRRQDRLSYLDRDRRYDHPADPMINGADAALISEPLAFRTGLEPGDTLRFATPSGPAAVAVSAVYYDYSSDAGMILVDRGWFIDHWRDTRLESIAVYLPDGMSLAEGREHVNAALAGEWDLSVFSNRDLRNAVLRVFDNTFAITYALRAVAIFVSLLAVGGGMAALVVERRRELAILRAVGGSRKQVIGRVLAESGLIGAVGWSLGAVLGILLSVVLTYVVNRYSFGWTLALRLPWGQLALSGVLMIGAALVAGAVPARDAAGQTIAHGVRVDSE